MRDNTKITLELCHKNRRSKNKVPTYSSRSLKKQSVENVSMCVRSTVAGMPVAAPYYECNEVHTYLAGTLSVDFFIFFSLSTKAVIADLCIYE